MAGDSANAVLSVIAEKVITPVVDAIGRQFGYLFFYKSNIKNLEKKVTQLEKSRDDVDSFFKAQSQNNEEITQSGAGWLKDVEALTMAAKEVLKAKDQLKGWCLNLKTRYVLSRKSTKLVAEIQELDDQAPKRGATNPPHPAGMLPGSSSNVASKDFKTRKEIMDKVMEALTDDRINIIGICGLGGIGKTTILHEVRERARTQKLFDEVAMTTVSQDINMSKIQSDLAGMLGLTSIKDVENIIARADLLHKRLTNGSRILVVLDDVWSEIKLEDVGIPVGNGRARCKVVLASRIQSVCTNMGAQKTIPVGVLSKEEAWHMFKKTTGDCVEREKLEDIAKEVADECGGLPIALLTLAKALSNKRREAWEDARRQLRQSCVRSIPGMSKEVYLSLKLSYDFLEKELPEAQPLLLICCQHPEDAEIEVEKLTRYCLALELFKNVDKVEDARNRTYAVIEHLSSCFLLQAVDVDEEEKDLKCETVKMHDVVRDVCLSIVSEVKDNVCMHIMAQDIDCGYDLGTSKVDYSKLKLLMNAPLDGNLLDISFLQQMEELRVFESISEEYDQPPPLQVLANLRMLSLERESLSEEITSTIGSLSRLEILSFWGSRISSFPSQIRPLRNLKLLDLRCKEGGGLIPSGILPGLNKLEVLYMGNFILLGAAHKDNQKNHNGEKSHGCITELDSLSNLTTLQILVEPWDLQDLQRFRFEKLKSFFFGLFRDSNDHYFIGSSRWCPVVQRTIKWGNLVGMKWVSGDNIKFIAMSTLDLQLNDVDDWIDPLIILKKFVSLKKLELIRCKQLEYIIPEGSLGELLVLSLNDMPVMRHLWVGPTDPLCLLNLREVVIVKCPAIESLFPQSAAKCLVQLRKLKVSDCLLLEEIFSKGESAGTTTTSRGAEIRKEPPNDFTIQFPKLEMLKLWNLPKLGVFYNFEHDDGSVQQSLFNPLVMLPSLKNLFCGYMHQLKQIVGGRMLTAASDDDWLQNLEKVIVEKCDSLETVFDFERLHLHSINGMGVNADHVLTLLGGLKYVTLLGLLKLEHLCRQIPQGIHAFQNLVSLEVYICDSLGYLISSSMAHMLVNLQSLSVWRCKSMKEVIKMINEDCGGAKKIVFPSLRKVKLEDLENLSSFFCSSDQQEFFNPLVMLPSLMNLSCSHMHQLKQIVGGGILIAASDDDDWLQNLEDVTVYMCDSLETVFDFERLHLHSINGMGENADHVLTLLGGLKSVDLSWLPKLEHLCRQIPEGIHAFQNLISLHVYECDNLGYLISSSMAHMLVNLQSLNVKGCESMKEVIKINENCGMKEIVFHSLSEVILKDLEKLSSFCSSDQQAFEFPSLGEVVIVNCLEMNTFCCRHVTAEKLHGVKPSDHANDDELVWKGDLNETVRHLNERNKVNQMNSDMEEDDVPEEGIADEYAECTKEGQGTPMKALMPLSVASSPNASLTPDVVSHSPPVSDNNNEELANSSSPDLGSVTLPPLIEFVPSASMEQSLHSSDSPVQPKTDKELSDMSFSSRDDDWKRSRILIQGVYVEAKLKTTFEEILTAKPNFLSGLRLKLAKMKTDIIESAIRSLQILRQSNALTISLEELAFIKDSLDDLETSGLDTAWLEKGYQRAILVMKEQKVVSAAAELVTLEREKTEDAAAFELARAAFELARAAFEMARAKLEASTARRDAFKAEFGALMQEELTAGKELFAGGFDLETSLGDGLLD